MSKTYIDENGYVINDDGHSIRYKVPIDDKLKNNNLTYIMEQRHNVKFFDQKNIPSKELIDKILLEGHKFIPHKNNLMAININVWGPEHDKEKESLVLNTVCGPGRDAFFKGGKYYGDSKVLKELYLEWRETYLTQNSAALRKFREKWNIGFNEQVRAPYLLSFTKRIKDPSDTQKKRGFSKFMAESVSKQSGDNKGSRWYLNAGMHGYGLSLLAVNYGLAAGFCKCFQNFPHLFTKILQPIVPNNTYRISFLLGIGYRDKNVNVYRDANKIEMSEYIFWN